MTAQSIDTIQSYHAHIYFDDPEQRRHAESLREEIAERFTVVLGRWWDRPIGPHARPMYQVAFPIAEFPRFLPWLMLNRGDLTILVHPNTGKPRPDHLRHALWLGEILAINDTSLREQSEPEPELVPNTHPTMTP